MGGFVGRHLVDIDICVGGCLEFLDEVRAAPLEDRGARLADEPPPTGSERWDALLAALGELLAGEAGLPAPEWVLTSQRRLAPWSPVTLPSEPEPGAPPAFMKHGVVIPMDFFSGD